MGKVADLVYQDLVARGKKISTAKEWRSVVDKFVEANGEKERYERADLIRFLALMREKYKHCQNTINKDLRAMKLLAEIQNWPGGFPKLALPKVGVDDVSRPVFEVDVFVNIIREARGVLIPRHMCYLALGATYGMRREEICHLNPAELKRGEYVTVKALKGGGKTVHLIPEQIRRWVSVYETSTIDCMTDMFEAMLAKLKIEGNGLKWGWHSVRRALATELLLREVSGINILRFMRWSEGSVKGEFGMLALYAKKDQARVDAEVFKVHPFLDAFK